jgi:geranylgeranyl transferase type-2 subunit beta
LSYLQELTLRLALGAAKLDEPFRERHRRWLQAQQRSDGGFAGREGESDPYYTAFALRGLLVVDGVDESVASRANVFLKTKLNAKLGVVDLISLVMAASILELTQGTDLMDEIRRSADQVTQVLLSLRSPDGGYAKTPGGNAGSTYQTFLTLLCWELIDRQEPEPDRVAEFLQSQRHVEGGFREIRVAKRAGVNPTAAGIGALKTLGLLDVTREQATAEFLVDMQTDEGGLSANDRIPMSDLLSSCTGLISLIDLDAVEQLDAPKFVKYVRSMERREIIALPDTFSSSTMATRFGMMDWDDGEETEASKADVRGNEMPGGFHGFEFDQAVDVEYTFYGLASTALIALVSG